MGINKKIIKMDTKLEVVSQKSIKISSHVERVLRIFFDRITRAIKSGRAPMYDQKNYIQEFTNLIFTS